MRRLFIIPLFLLLMAVVPARGQQPLYIVNGVERTDTSDIDPEIIERIEELPADEESIARYGEKASNGVVIITLKYDEPPRFVADTLAFSDYIASQIKWTETDPTARVVVRYNITTEGDLVVDRVLQSTDSRLRRRVLKALEECPRWQPATKAGKAVESCGVLRIQLPKGRRLPRQMELVIR